MPASAAIRVDELTKMFLGGGGLRTCFRRRRPAEVLRGISLTVAPGEIVGLLGPNGAGKTTLLAILATYLLPSSGRVWVCGHDVERAPLAVRRAVGYCPAGAGGFAPQLSGRHNLRFFARLTTLLPRQARARVDELWTLVGLEAYRDLPVARYIGGVVGHLPVMSLTYLMPWPCGRRQRRDALAGTWMRSTCTALPTRPPRSRGHAVRCWQPCWPGPGVVPPDVGPYRPRPG